MSSTERPDFSDYRTELRAIYADLDGDIQRLGPVCALSGRCCRFKEYGHTLFVSLMELEVLLADAPPPVRPLDEGASCPWQDQQNRCVAREARPLGCRVYFCDSSYEEPVQALSERYISRLKRLAESGQVPWSYFPLHHHLRAASDRGWFHEELPGVESIPNADPETANSKS
jgi:hypothetical protein